MEHSVTTGAQQADFELRGCTRLPRQCLYRHSGATAVAAGSRQPHRLGSSRRQTLELLAVVQPLALSTDRVRGTYSAAEPLVTFAAALMCVRRWWWQTRTQE